MSPDGCKAVSFLAAKARDNFFAFCLLMAPAIVATPKVVISRFHEYLCDLAQGVVDGKLPKRQCVSAPPQHGKSTILSVLFPLWLLGKQPGVNIAITGFSNELVTDFSRQIKLLMDTDEYRVVFPGVVLDPLLDRLDYWRTTTGSVLRAKSTGKKLTGRKVDVLISDDIHAGREEAESPIRRNRVKKWFSSDCLSRLAPGAAIFVIATRWHPEDLIGYLTGEEYVNRVTEQNAEDQLYGVVNMEAICEHPESDPLEREEGEPLFPEIRTLKFLEGQKASMESYDWDSQYQGRPRIGGAAQADTGKIQMVDFDELPDDLEFARGWDLALSEKQVADFTAGALCGYSRALDRLYIVDVARIKLAWAKAKPFIVAKTKQDKEEFGVHRIGVEAVAGFEIGRSELVDALIGEVKVEKRNPQAKTDKLRRAQPWLNKIEAGKVYMVRGSWNRVFRDELETFPLGTHDDQIDAVSICYETLVVSKKVLYA